MKFLRWEFHAAPSDMVHVKLDHAANDIVLDDTAFAGFRRSHRRRCLGGYYNRTPVRFALPHEDSWHVAVHLGG